MSVRERVLREVDDRRDQFVDLLRKLIAAQQDGENAVQAIVARELEAIGAQVDRIDYVPADVPLVDEFAVDHVVVRGRRASVTGTLRGNDIGKSLILFAHPDSEPVQGTEGWDHAPFLGEVVQGRLYGWGVADDLSGVACGLAALTALVEVGVRPGGTVVLASTPSKRHARGVAALMSHGITADAAIYLHPAESGAGLKEIKAFASGQVEFKVVVTGRNPATSEPGHTAFAHCAVNPLDKAFLVYNALKALDERRGGAVHHPRLDAAVGRSTNLQVSSIICGEGGKLSRLAQTCVIGGAVSFPPVETIACLQDQVSEAVMAAARTDDWLNLHPPEIEWVSGVSGVEISDSHPLYRLVHRAIVAQTGTPPAVNPMHTSSDIRHPIVQRNIPTVGFGPLCGSLTQTGGTDEWVDVEDYMRMIKVTASVIVDWTNASAWTST